MMRQRLSISAIAATLLVGVPVTLAAQQIQGRSERTFSVSERVAAGGVVNIYAAIGDITITEGSGNTMEFRAEKDVRRGELEDVGFVVLRDAGGVTICAVMSEDDECDADGLNTESRSRWTRGNRSIKLAITVKVPRGTRLRTTSGNGDIAATAALAEARIRSGNGRVKVSGVSGSVDASTGNGEVTVDGTGGPVKARSGNGDVTIGTVNGPVSASSGNGDIRVSMERLTGSGDLEFSSGNGRIVVEVPADFSAEVEANSGNGRVTTDFPITIKGRLTPSRLRGTIGNGGRLLRMHTGNGTMEIRKRA
ncbi:MAG: hypothetical protein ABS52_07630 [Gemmatimonadetes bacterium SCN 70-22]|nr:MAG: hypothetical protein ABS52_07630 [Gemmatimonadetes bacterium SCN 70-22]